MKKWKQTMLEPSRAIGVGFWLFNLACLLTALAMPDRGQMLAGLGRICTLSSQVTKSYFDPSYGGLSATFLNVALVGTIMALMYMLPGAKRNATAVLAFFLTIGFCFWGVNILNLWFGMAGVLLYCAVKHKKPGEMVNAMIFTTGIAPLYTDLLFRYPQADWHGFAWQGLLIALAVGVFVGFLLPAGLVGSPKAHRGFSLYSAALPMGMIAFVLRGFLYAVLGANLPEVAGVGLKDSFWGTSNLFCLLVFGCAIILAFVLGATPKQYWRLLKHSGHNVDYTLEFGVPTAMLNFGIYGLFITAYYDLIGASWNAVTLGLVFCVVCLCCSGSHPRNVLPIMIGYVLMGLLAKWLFMGNGSFPVPETGLTVSAQALAVGLCYATGLSPISGKYGWGWGVAAGALHLTFVTIVPQLHGGFLLYNGGFTAGLVCLFLVPVLEHFLPEKSKVATK